MRGTCRQLVHPAQVADTRFVSVRHTARMCSAAGLGPGLAHNGRSGDRAPTATWRPPRHAARMQPYRLTPQCDQVTSVPHVHAILHHPDPGPGLPVPRARVVTAPPDVAGMDVAGFCSAVAERDIATIHRVLQQQPALLHSAGGPGGRTALHAAVEAGDPAILRLLLAAGADAAAADTDGITPLWIAAQQVRHGGVRAWGQLPRARARSTPRVSAPPHAETAPAAAKPAAAPPHGTGARAAGRPARSS